MKYVLISNHPSRSISINLLDYLELRPDFLPSLSYWKNDLWLYSNGRPLLYKKDLIEADIDMPRVRFDWFG